MSRSSIGLIGAGLLGQSLAHCLLESGYQIIGYDLDTQRRQDLVNQGGVAAESSVDVIRQCQTTLLSLPDSEIVHQVIHQVEPDLEPGDILVDTTTGNPQDTRAMASRLAIGSISYLDATVVGSSQQARSRDVLLLVGGEKEPVTRCQSLLNSISHQVRYLGPSGSGATMKLVVNLVLGLNRAVLAEGLSLAASCGLDQEQVLDVLRKSPAYSTVMDTKGSKMVQRDFAPQARLTQHLKDVCLIRQLGLQHEHPLPLSQVHQSLLETAQELGYGEQDNSAIIMASDGP